MVPRSWGRRTRAARPRQLIDLPPPIFHCPRRPRLGVMGRSPGPRRLTLSPRRSQFFARAKTLWIREVARNSQVHREIDVQGSSRERRC
jgi:hypothetical protein